MSSVAAIATKMDSTFLQVSCESLEKVPVKKLYNGCKIESNQNPSTQVKSSPRRRVVRVKYLGNIVEGISNESTL